jgi:hypothetical protein
MVGCAVNPGSVDLLGRSHRFSVSVNDKKKRVARILALIPNHLFGLGRSMPLVPSMRPLYHVWISCPVRPVKEKDVPGNPGWA